MRLKSIAQRFLADLADPFLIPEARRINQRRLEHLASLRLRWRDRQVHEVGAGVGELTGFFVDRGANVNVSDARQENVDRLRERYPSLIVRRLDIERDRCEKSEAVVCYGTLYHTFDPVKALENLSEMTSGKLVLETCVSTSGGVNRVVEPSSDNQSVKAFGCRPNRQLVWDTLKRLFAHVYTTKAQPSHEEFPLNWNYPGPGLNRAVFVASRSPIESDQLVEDLLEVHSTEF